jgi:hypothetical protein
MFYQQHIHKVIYGKIPINAIRNPFDYVYSTPTLACGQYFKADYLFGETDSVIEKSELRLLTKRLF